MAMRIRRYDAKRITQYGRSRATLDATATGRRHRASICPVLPRRTADTMVIDFGIKNQVVALWKSLSKASVQKAQNGPSTQLIEATSCVERSNATMKAEELS
jgi:hypothetical protein